MNILCVRGTFNQLPSSFCASVRPSDFLSQDLPSTSNNHGTFRQLFVHSRVHPSTFCASKGSSVNFPCVSQTFRQHKANFHAATGPSATFHAAAGPSINFLCGHGALCKVTSTFCAAEGPSGNYLCGHGTFCKLPSTFLAFARHSVNFSCSHVTFREVASVRPRDIPSAFCVAEKPYVNFRELSVRTSTLCQISFRPLDHP